MKVNFIRTLRTPYSERFLIQLTEGEDSAAIDLHYLKDGSVAGTLFLFEGGGITENMAPDLLRHIDTVLLPDVSFEEHNLSFTVVHGRVIGNFVPGADETPK